MGETKNRQIAAPKPAVEPMVVDTLGGRMHVCWDESSQATPNGQLVFFEGDAAKGSNRPVAAVRSDEQKVTQAADPRATAVIRV